MNFNINNNSNTYDYMNSFFGGNSANNGPSSLLGDYFSIKNGSYYKIAKKYYASEAANKKQGKALSNSDEKSLALVKDSAQKAVSSVKKLMSSDLFKKVEKRDENGNITSDYDKDAILKNLKDFVSDYNSVVKNSGEIDDTKSLKSGVRMINETKVYAGALSKIGISIKNDNTLEIDEKAFDKAKMTDVKSLFTGGVSFASNVQSQMLQVYNSASSAINSSGGIYSSQGVTSLSIGSMFDSIL